MAQEQGITNYSTKPLFLGKWGGFCIFKGDRKNRLACLGKSSFFFFGQV